MVSKNNHAMKQAQIAEREVPHYGLRKLGIGVVSVLLGTTMYFGANNMIADAATIDDNGSTTSDAAKTTASQPAVTNSVVPLHTDVATHNSAASQPATSDANTTTSSSSADSTNTVASNQVNQPVVAQDQSERSTTPSDPTTNAGSVILYSYNEGTAYQGENYIKIPYKYNAATGKYDVIKLDPHSNQILNNKDWQLTSTTDNPGEIIYRNNHNQVISSFDPNTLVDKSANTAVFVDISGDGMGKSINSFQQQLDKHPIKLTDGMWTDQYQINDSNAYLLTAGPLSINGPAELMQAQTKAGMSYSYPKDNFVFNNLPKDYYKPFVNLGTLSTGDGVKLKADGTYDLSGLPNDETVNLYVDPINHSGDLLNEEQLQHVVNLMADAAQGKKAQWVQVSSGNDTGQEEFVNLTTNEKVAIDSDDLLSSYFGNRVVKTSDSADETLNKIADPSLYNGVYECSSQVLPIFGYSQTGQRDYNKPVALVGIYPTYDGKVLLASRMIDPNYQGQLDSIWSYVVGGSSDGSIGFLYMPVVNEHTTGQVKFVDVTDPQKPQPLKVDNLNGMVGTMMDLSTAQKQLDDYLSTKGGGYILADDNSAINRNSQIISKEFTDQVEKNVITINLMHLQKATLKYVDDSEGGQPIDYGYYDEDGLQGKAGQAITFTTNPVKTIALLKKRHYVFASASGNAVKLKPGVDDKAGLNDYIIANYNTATDDVQNIVIHMKHAYDTVSKSKTVKETINYLYAGSKWPAASVYHAKDITFTGTQSKDEVTGETVGDIKWTPTTSDFQNVESPKIKGYTADQLQAGAITVNPDSQNVVINVYYKADQQPLTYTVIDDTTGKTLEDHQDLAKGDTNSLIPNSVASKYDQIRNGWIAKGYQLDLNEANGLGYDFLPDNFGTGAQNVTVYLIHGQKTVPAKDTADITETIHYVYGNGPKKGQPAAKDYEKTYHFTATEIVDAITGDPILINGQPQLTWSSDQHADAVESPVAYDRNYTPEQIMVPGQLISHDSQPIKITVYYYVGDQNVHVHYIDVNNVPAGKNGYQPTDGNELINHEQNLKGEAGDHYSNTLWNYAGAGYQLAQDPDPAAKHGTFDDDSQSDQDYYVYLTHKLDDVTSTKQVRETINYLYKNNNQIAAPAHHAKAISFTGTQSKDEVTDEMVGDIKWTPATSDFQNVESPQITGYTADQLQAGATTVNPDSQDVIINVYYSADQQPLTYTVVDDTADKTLVNSQNLANGDTNSLIPNSVAFKYDQIRNSWLNKGYQLDTTKVNGLGYDLLPDNFGTGAQNVTIYLVHGQKTVPVKDTTAGDATQTITYIYGNGPKEGQTAAPTKATTYHFTATEIVDAVTGEPILKDGQPQLTWSPTQLTDVVTTPAATDTNYTPDQTNIPAERINHGDKLNHVVRYYIGNQNVHVHYIDVNNVPAGKNGYQPTDGNELINHEQNLKGEAGESYTNALWNYAGAGYQLAQALDPATKQGTFDDDSQTDQDYYVYLTHKLDDVTSTKQVGETINYLYKNNNQIAAPAHHAQAINFTGTQSKDEVTGEMVGDIKWTPATSDFQNVESPQITGYEADQLQAGATTVKPTSQDVVINVYYSADQQPLTYTVIDDTTGKTLEDRQELAKGDTNSLIPNSVASKYDQIRNSWLNKGYQLDTTKVNGLGYDFLPDNFGTDAQNVTIYLVHGQKTVPVKDTTAGDATQTITYVYGNGPKEGQTAAPTKATTYHFTATEIVDAVTGEPILKDGQPQVTWSPTQLTDAVTTPAAEDTSYTPDQTSVPAERINHGDKLTHVVRYYVGDQNVHVHYIDVNNVPAGKNGYQPTDGNELANHLQSLRGAAGESYTNALWNYASAGYELAQALDPAVKHGTFDDDSQMDQNYYVYLKHGLDNVKTTKTVKETINYLYADSNRLAAPSYQAHDITFTGTQSKDKVTGEMVGDIKWTPTTSDFQDVESPKITGYTADHAKAGAKTVMPTSQNVVINVYYKADQQPLTYTVIDDTTGKTLEDHQDLAKGDTNSLIPNSVVFKYDQIRNSWLNKGYQLDTTKVNGLGYDFLPDNFGTDAQNVTIYLVHGQKTVPVKDTTAGDATQTITYVYGNGPKEGQSAAPTKATTYHFTATEIVDAVTGEPILKDGQPQLTWSPTQLTDAITTPAAEDTNYVPDQTSVPAERINHGDKLTHVVHYYVGNQNVHVHYIDVNNIKAGKKGYQPTDGNELINHEQNLKGEAGESYTNTLWNYAGAGYQLAQALDPATKHGTFDDDSQTDQDYYVYLTHELDKVPTTKTVNETINYLYTDSDRPAAPSYQAPAITFTGSQHKDKVTGDLIGDITWESANDKFKDVASPKITGYTADQLQAGAVTVTPKSQDVVINVYYSADQQPLTYTVIDDTTGKTLEDHQGLAKGNTNSLIPNSVASKYDQIRNIWLAKGYRLDLSKANGLGYDFLPDNFGTGAQNVTVYLIHGQKTAPAKDTADITEIIHYVYGNGPKKGQPAAKDYEKTYHFTATEIVDAITGDPILKDGQPQLTWSADQHTDAVESPVAYDRNYTPEQTMVPGQLISHNSQPIEIIIPYYVGNQNVHIHYIDVNGVKVGTGSYQSTDGVELTNHEQNLKGEAGDHYSNTLWNYVGSNYKLAQALDPATEQGTFDDDSQTDQDYYVYLTHELDKVTTTKQVGETINYLYKSNSQVAAPAYHAKDITFTGTQSKDEVTGKMVGDIKWTPTTSDFQDVASPKIKGYTADKLQAGAASVNPDSQDVVINVYYKADQQPLTYTVVDDMTGKTLEDHQDLAKGDTNSLIPGSITTEYEQIRNNWINKGYQLDTAKASGLGYDILPNTFGTAPQNVTIYLIHGQKTAPAKDTADITETIHYVYGNGPKKGQLAAKNYEKTYHFTATEIVDAITGDPILKDGQPQLTWSPDQHTDVVESPTAYDRDYVPKQTIVPGQLISHNSQPIEIIIPYFVGSQNVHIHYIDVNGIKAGKNGYQPTDGNELTNHLQSLKGEAGESYTNTLWNYAGSSYKLAQALDPAAEQGTFDDDSQIDQDYYVYLKHELDNVTTTKTVEEIISYLYADSNRPAAPSQVHNITFTGTQHHDKVTDKRVGNIKWTPANGNFQDVVSPKITGYTADHTKAGAATVTPASRNIVINVYYKADQQPLTYTVIDDTIGKTLEDHQDLAKGNTNSLIPNSVASKYDQIRNGWLAKGYQLDTTKANGLGYDFLPDNFSIGAQNVTVYLVHGQKTVPVKDATAGNATQTITYIYGNGPKKGQTAAPTKATTYHFTATEIVDAVTGKPILKDGQPQVTWSPTQLTDVVTTPTAEDTNYTPDQTSIPAERINHGDKLTHVIHYYIGDQNIHVHYIDVNGVKVGKDGYQSADGNELTSHLQSLKGEAGAKYTNVLWDYGDFGYKLVQKDSGATAGSFDGDSKTDQNYYVYLTHDLDTIKTTKQVGEIINYLYKSNHQSAVPAYHAKNIIFTGTQSKDKVTGEMVGDIKWTPTTSDFQDVESPKITGYTADHAKAGAKTVMPTSQNVVINVYYKADQQPLTYTVVDSTANKTLVDHQDLAKGNTNSLIPNSVASKYDQIRNGWLAKGYQLDTTKANGLGYDFLPDNFGTGAQNVIIYLVHGQKTVSVKDTAAGDATQTITYVYGNGPKKGQTAAPTKATTYHFTATEVVDAVTGEPILRDGQPQLTWSPVQLTDAVMTPAAEDTNYVPDQTSVPAERINHGDKLNHVVRYYIGNQNVHVHYIDVNNVPAGKNGYQPTDGNELINHEQNLKGEAGESYTNALWNYAGAGYQLAQALDPATKQGTFDDDSQTDQDYYVYLTHKLDDVTSTKQVGETINYLYKSNNQVAAPAHHAQAINFTGTQSKDEVTGKMVGDIKWTPDNGSFQDVVSPKITGYTADHTKAGATNVNPDSQDVVINVYYSANQQPLTYTVVDGTANKTLVDHQGLAKGDTNGLIPNSVAFKYDQIRNSWLNKGYQLDTTKVNGLGYDLLPDNFGTGAQNVTIYLVHGQKTVPVKDTTAGDATQIITYVYGNGPKKGQTAAPTKATTYHFTATEIVDAVTGEPILKDGQPQLTWSPTQLTDVVTTPAAEDTNYAPDQISVPSERIDHGDRLTHVVYYYVNQQPTSPTQPTNKPTSPTSPTQPTNKPTSPTSPTQPTNKPTSPTSPTQPTNKPTSPSTKPAPQTKTLKTVPTTQQVNLHRGTPVSQRPARQNSTRLPQTGNQDAVSAASLGLMGLALAGGLAGMKKRHE